MIKGLNVWHELCNGCDLLEQMEGTARLLKLCNSIVCLPIDILRQNIMAAHSQWAIETGDRRVFFPVCRFCFSQRLVYMYISCQEVFEQAVLAQKLELPSTQQTKHATNESTTLWSRVSLWKALRGKPHQKVWLF